MKAKIFSRDENLIYLIVSLINVAFADAFLRSFADLYLLFAPANCDAEDFRGRDAND